MAKIQLIKISYLINVNGNIIGILNDDNNILNVLMLKVDDVKERKMFVINLQSNDIVIYNE
jgi:hypothetical protein